jgi:acetyl-CoA carboxylase carboxyl transferase subunit alpha
MRGIRWRTRGDFPDPPRRREGTARSVVEGEWGEALRAWRATSTACGGPPPRTGEDLGALTPAPAPLNRPSLMVAFLDFEKPVAELRARIDELRETADANSTLKIDGEVAKLQQQSDKVLRDLYAKLTPWQKTQVARHQERPHFKDYVAGVASDFMMLAGDRAFGDDQAIIGGLARIGGRRVMLIGHEKGDDTASRIRHNFGMAKPEGYRKAIRLMKLAERFGLPVVTLVDTAGAFPGVQAEERGQAEAIARSTEQCLELKVPIVAAIVGEGGSGGAVALAGANRVLMFEHAIYSVISPEGASSILWRTADRASDAADAMKITAQDLEKLGVVDRIVAEPVGGAHRDRPAAIASLRAAVEQELSQLATLSPAELLAARREKFLAIG